MTVTRYKKLRRRHPEFELPAWSHIWDGDQKVIRKKDPMELLAEVAASKLTGQEHWIYNNDLPF